MFSLKADDIYCVAKPFHICSKLVGIAAFTIEKKNGIFVSKKSSFDVLCIFAALAWSLTATYIFCSHTNNFAADFNPFTIATNIYQKLVLYTVLIFIFFVTQSSWWILFSHEHFCRILNLIADVDEELKLMKCALNLKKHKKVILSFLFASKLGLVLNIASMYLSERQENILNIPILIYAVVCVSIEIGVTIVSQFIFLIWAVKLRYEKINLYLEKNFLSTNCDPENANKNLNRAAILHDKLVEVSEAINRAFGVPVSIES